MFAFSTKAQRTYSEVQYQAGDVVLFGPETRGLPDEIRNSLPQQQLLKVPMRPGSRSLNLSNTVAVVVYEALRQQGFAFGD
jgi:tRNA (cytidine/uridine-2'-O-)-methyltransferase